jgi:site-specific DNA-methyltransferase (adenine-specific)/modification methylase
MSEKVIIGNATLILGDCREVLPTLPRVDACVTDPPYGLNFCAYSGRAEKVRRLGKLPRPELKWDKTTVNLDPIIYAADYIVIWGGNYYPLPPSRGWLAWFKPDSPPSMGDFEMAWTNQDQNARLISHSISATNAERVGHPTQKPLRVIKWTLEQIPAHAHTILDPYMGSGTTGVACAQMGRAFIGIEIDPRYFEIACRRIEAAQAQPDMFIEPAAMAKAEQLGMELPA